MLALKAQPDRRVLPVLPDLQVPLGQKGLLDLPVQKAIRVPPPTPNRNILTLRPPHVWMAPN
jgi:hypothetical protein